MFSCEFCENFKNTFFTEHLWTTASVIRTAEYGILVIKKTSVKTLQILLYSVFLNVPIKHVQEKEKRKEIWLQKKQKKKHSFISTSLKLQHWKTKIIIFYVNFVSWSYIYFGERHVFLISFICKYTSWSWTNKSETLGKLSKYQSLWWKCCTG